MNIKKYRFINRIKEELNEIKNFPLEGIDIVSLDNEFTEFIINIELLYGIFEGYCIQLLLKFNYNYPKSLPKILIFPGQKIESFHNLIFISNEEFGNKNYNTFYLDTNIIISFRSLLLKIQNFLCNPQIEEPFLPTLDEINELMKSMGNYRMNFMKGNEFVTHTWKNPYPNKNSLNDTIKEINKIVGLRYYQKENTIQFVLKTKNNNENEKNKEDEKNYKYFIKKNNLTCFVFILNYRDTPNFFFGYPIIKNLYGEILPYPEIMCLEAFERKKKYIYDYWLPVYINNDYFNKNANNLLIYFSKIKYGEKNQKNFTFELEDIFEVLINILNTMIIHILSNNQSFIRCFFHFIFLYKNLFWNYKKVFKKYANNYLDNYFKEIKNIKKDINNSSISDIVKMFLLLLFDNDPNSQKKEKFKNILKKLKKRMCLKVLFNNPNFKIKNQKLFIDDLYKNEIFDKIVDIIISDTNINKGKKSKNFRKKIIGNILDDFNEIYNKCDDERKNKINELLFDKINICDYFEIDSKLIFNNNNKGLDNSVPGDILYLLKIFYILEKKINEPNFFDELIKNDGVLISTYKFIKEIENIINEKEKDILENIEPLYEKDIIDIAILEINIKQKNSYNKSNLIDKIKKNNIIEKKGNHIEIQKEINFEIIEKYSNNNYIKNNNNNYINNNLNNNSFYYNYSDNDIDENENSNDEIESKLSFDENEDKFFDEDTFNINTDILFKRKNKKRIKIVKKKKEKTELYTINKFNYFINKLLKK